MLQAFPVVAVAEAELVTAAEDEPLIDELVAVAEDELVASEADELVINGHPLAEVVVVGAIEQAAGVEVLVGATELLLLLIKEQAAEAEVLVDAIELVLLLIKEQAAEVEVLVGAIELLLLIKEQAAEAVLVGATEEAELVMTGHPLAVAEEAAADA